MKYPRLIIPLMIGLIWTAPIFARDDGGPKYPAPAHIIASLPKICWWFYMDNVPNTAEYNVRVTCGSYSNHYCPGLVNIKQAENSGNKRERLEQLRYAKRNMEYTLRFVTGHPECSILPAARINLERIKFQIDLLSYQGLKR